MADKMLVRSYTPTAPIIGADTEDGTFDLVVKTYFPTDEQPGGALSNILDCMKEGEEVEIRGPTGDIKYLGDGKFEIFGEEEQFGNITLILGGSGITPGYQLIARIMATASDKTKIKVVDANKDESSILLREDLDNFAKEHGDSFEIQHILSHPSDNWKGEKGHVDEDKIKKYSYAPEKESGKKNVVFLCGPPAMIQKAAMPALRDWVSSLCFMCEDTLILTSTRDTRRAGICLGSRYDHMIALLVVARMSSSVMLSIDKHNELLPCDAPLFS
jgi:nitrate reductase (NAD(P)H)